MQTWGEQQTPQRQWFQLGIDLFSHQHYNRKMFLKDLLYNFLECCLTYESLNKAKKTFKIYSVESLNTLSGITKNKNPCLSHHLYKLNCVKKNVENRTQVIKIIDAHTYEEGRGSKGASSLLRLFKQ